MELSLKKLAQMEFRMILETFILQILNTSGSLKMINNNQVRKKLILQVDDGHLYIFPSINAKFGYKIVHNANAQEIAIANKILNEIIVVSKYIYSNDQYPLRYKFGKTALREAAYSNSLYYAAYEIGICRTIISDLDEATTLHKLLSRLFVWASSTYEGESVPFGIIIDYDQTCDSSASYLDFLESSYSAVFSDGIFAGIMLDRKGKILRHISISNNYDEKNDFHPAFVPYQYVGIANICDSPRKVGIVVLSNGDILLIKERNLVFAKRNGKWHYFPSNHIFSILSSQIQLSDTDISACTRNTKKKTEEYKDDNFYETMFNKTLNKEKGNLRNLYAQRLYISLLDISFNHNGGCLAIVQSIDSKNKNQKKVSSFIKRDLLDDMVTPKVSKSALDSEIAKSKVIREKKQAIIAFIRGENPSEEDQRFYCLSRKLRHELLSLDGAVVINSVGKVLSAGSIVRIDGGSEGGGRTAAARQLAEFGLSVKISEDGYLEAYVANEQAKVDRVFKVQ